MKFSRKLQLLEATVRDDIRRMHEARLGYAPTAVTCNFLKNCNLIIVIERPRSSTEQFLLKQEKLQLAQEVGLAINQILKSEIADMLKNRFALPIADCSFLTPTSIESFSVWVAIDSEKMASSQLDLQEMAEPSRQLRPSSATDTLPDRSGQ